MSTPPIRALWARGDFRVLGYNALGTANPLSPLGERRQPRRTRRYRRRSNRARRRWSWCSGFELGLGPGSSYTICVKILGQIGDNLGLDMEGSTGETILDSLNCQGHFAKDPHLVATKEKLLTLEVGHLETQASDQVVVDK